MNKPYFFYYPYLRKNSDVTSLRSKNLLVFGLALFTSEINGEFIHNIYFENSNHIHNINIIHRYGTCLVASALFTKAYKFMTSSIINLKFNRL